MNDLGHGQVWWADLDKVRPVVVLTREGRASVAPGARRTHHHKVRGLTTEVAIGEPEGVRDGSVASLDNVQLVPVDRLLRRTGRVAPDRWHEFCAAVHAVMAC